MVGKDEVDQTSSVGERSTCQESSRVEFEFLGDSYRTKPYVLTHFHRNQLLTNHSYRLPEQRNELIFIERPQDA